MDDIKHYNEILSETTVRIACRDGMFVWYGIGALGAGFNTATDAYIDACRYIEAGGV